MLFCVRINKYRVFGPACLLVVILCFKAPAIAQDNKRDTTLNDLKRSQQLDLIDIAGFIIRRNHGTRQSESTGIASRKLYISAAPIVEYTIATGFSPGIAGNIAFKNSVLKKTNTSSILGAIKYTLKKQLLVPFQSSFWTPGNKFNFLGDWRFLDYSQDTYGLGGHTTESDKYVVKFKYLRLYEYAVKKLYKNIYGGIGYQLDYHWNIAESGITPGRITDFVNYGFTKNSVSSGIGFTLFYDTRENSINPEGGAAFAKIQVTQNSRLLGSNSNWSTILIDLRKYVGIGRNLILAGWLYSNFTLSGKPPYLDLPGTGSDTYNNTGRGYEQNRFTGRNLLYAETELRFVLTKNGLLGGVIFCNAQSIAEPVTNHFESILPGYGAGLRIQFNKFSKTNACIDYGLGARNSHGFVGNLGEVF